MLHELHRNDPASYYGKSACVAVRLRSPLSRKRRHYFVWKGAVKHAILSVRLAALLLERVSVHFDRGWGESAPPPPPEPGHRFVLFVRAYTRCIPCRFGSKVSRWRPVSFIFFTGSLISYLLELSLRPRLRALEERS